MRSDLSQTPLLTRKIIIWTIFCSLRIFICCCPKFTNKSLKVLAICQQGLSLCHSGVSDRLRWLYYSRYCQPLTTGFSYVYFLRGLSLTCSILLFAPPSKHGQTIVLSIGVLLLLLTALFKSVQSLKYKNLFLDFCCTNFGPFDTKTDILKKCLHSKFKISRPIEIFKTFSEHFLGNFYKISSTFRMRI